MKVFWRKDFQYARRFYSDSMASAFTIKPDGEIDFTQLKTHEDLDFLTETFPMNPTKLARRLFMVFSTWAERATIVPWLESTNVRSRETLRRLADPRTAAVIEAIKALDGDEFAEMSLMLTFREEKKWTVHDRIKRLSSTVEDLEALHNAARVIPLPPLTKRCRGEHYADGTGFPALLGAISRIKKGLDSQARKRFAACVLTLAAERVDPDIPRREILEKILDDEKMYDERDEVDGKDKITILPKGLTAWILETSEGETVLSRENLCKLLRSADYF